MIINIINASANRLIRQQTNSTHVSQSVRTFT